MDTALLMKRVRGTGPAGLAWLGCVSLISIIASGCVSPPSSIVHIRVGQLPADQPQGAVSNLTVTTFNVWGLPSWINGVSQKRYSRIAQAAAHLGSDVVLFQEVWTRRSFAELSGETIGSAGGWWAASARRSGTFLGQNGLLTLSRYPIVGSEVRYFSVARLPDSLMNKGALKVTINLGNGQRFNIWNVHLQDGACARIRSHQTAELIRWIRAAQDGQIADIVGGDFNFTPESPEFLQFALEIGPTVYQLAGSPEVPTWDGLKPKPGGGESLDHIFVMMRKTVSSLHARPRLVFAPPRRADRLSDHVGMESALDFGPTREVGSRMVARQSPRPILVDALP